MSNLLLAIVIVQTVILVRISWCLFVARQDISNLELLVTYMRSSVKKIKEHLSEIEKEAK